MKYSNFIKFSHPFEKILSVCVEDSNLHLTGQLQLPWSDFLLNPRRLRGSDFLMRWSQGVWSEERLNQAISQSGKYFALPYGPSGTAPSDDVRKFELYFERLEKAGLGQLKRPDLLVFAETNRPKVESIVSKLGGIPELPFILEEKLQELLSLSIIAVECENSLWKARLMPAYGQEMRPQKRLGGRPGFSKASVLPTIILKEEDRKPLHN